MCYSVDPAYAGMILNVGKAPTSKPCGPRVCGDDPSSWENGDKKPEWTPRMRG